MKSQKRLPRKIAIRGRKSKCGAIFLREKYMELGVFINGIADSIVSNNGIAAILDNPLYTAAIIVFIIALIYYFSGMSGSARAMFYAFCATSVVIFIYHHRFRTLCARNTKVSEIQTALANPPTLQTSELVPVIQPIYLKNESALNVSK